LSSSSVHTIVFDAVGTLIYARPTVAEVYHRIASEFGWRGSIAGLKDRFTVAFNACNPNPSASIETNESEQKVRWRRIVGHVFEDVAIAAVEQIFSRLWHHFAQASAWEIYVDAATAIEYCERHKILWCIGSNFDARLHQVVAGHPLLRRSQRVFCSSEIGYDKPSLEFFRGIERELSLAPQQLIMIGDDMQLDVQGSQAAGWTGLWINRQDSMQQLHRLIDQWNREAAH
jgi:putative hydrolase of the HAD superfamily